MSAPIAAIIISKKRRHIINAFIKTKTTSPKNAKTLQEIGLTNSVLLKIQKMQGVIVEAKPNHFYLDKLREEKVARTRLLILTSLIVISLLLIIYFAS